MFEAFRARVLRDGDNIQQSTEAQTKRTMVNMILDSPSLTHVSVNLNELIPVPCIVSDIKTHFKRRFLFLPDTQVFMGDYVTTEDELTYLVTDKTYNSKQPQAMGDLCNEDFPISTLVNKVRIGTNAQGRPIYEEQKINIMKPAVISGSMYNQLDNNPIVLPNETKTVKIPFSLNVDEYPKINAVVTVRDRDYMVTEINTDFVLKDKGYLEVRIERIPEVSNK